MAKTESDVRAAGSAQTPRGVNHVVLNVRDIEVSHRFWTEIVGFRLRGGAQAPARAGPAEDALLQRRRRNGDLSHHDLALAEVPRKEGAAAEGAPETWSLMGPKVGLNHVAIAWPDRESWLKQLEFLQAKGVTFHRRINHGMTHSVYISDPDGHGIEVLYELPRDVWEQRHRRGPELRRGPAHRGPRLPRGPHRQPAVLGSGLKFTTFPEETWGRGGLDMS